MSLVPENINEAIKHLSPKSNKEIDEFWNSLKNVDGKELGEILADYLNLRTPQDALDGILRCVDMPFENVLNIIDDMRFRTVIDKIRNTETQINSLELYTKLFDSLETEQKNQAIDIFRRDLI